MKYRIGIGLLLPDLQFNFVRNIELNLHNSNEVTLGLSQPPHITIKRPFTLNSKGELDSFIERLTHMCLKPCTVRYKEVTVFPDNTVYFSIEDNSDLHDLHKRTLDICKEFNIGPDELEGDNVIFHTSLALGLSDNQSRTALRSITLSGDELMPFKLSSVGIFMQLPSNGTWIIIHTIKSSA